MQENINRPTQSKETETPKGAGQKKVIGYPQGSVDADKKFFFLIKGVGG